MIIYKHTCTINGKCYIGLIVKPITKRCQVHCSDTNIFPKRKFFAALSKHGKGISNPNCGPIAGKMGWKKIDGIRTWFLKEVR